MSDQYILEVKNLTKDFPGVRALDNVDFKVRKGEIHCLVGENGAGKSTLMNVVSGVFPKGDYEGQVIFKGKETNYKSTRDSENDGLSIIHQELTLSPYLSIYENLFLGHMKTKFGIIDWEACLRDSYPLLKRVGLDEVPHTIVSKMSVGKQQLVEIARAISRDAQLIIFDEPTSSLNDDESQKLLDLLREFRNEGITCIMISHKLDEVLAVADSITILRDGLSVVSYDVTEKKVSRQQIIKDMVGRELKNLFPKKEPNIGDIVFEVKNWTVYHPDYHNMKIVDNASFHLKKGEIVGFCGPMGAGRTELMMSIFGQSYGYGASGEILLNGEKVSFRNPKDAIEKGVGYVSEDRKSLGLILIQDVKTNISNSSLPKLSKRGIINKDLIRRKAEEYKEALQIRTPSLEQLVLNLSGGNQQKVVLSRSLLADPDIFIVDEPTRGIDVGAKFEIYSILNNMVKEGKSVIVVSSELAEAISMSDRIYVMNEGKIKGVLDRDEATQEGIMHMALVD
ncbi:MAG: sugar ABC transporter ATP-binding protein [Sphaerochaetaceae bacterium]|jgi:putative multiple sugar transport system ATP-binding protein|nr:sugar ABC transporter ATP-binding protein [Sphaerochaetaceae bacterium]MDD4218937.1 sugar ABC transporter ATP-binding protein [Sphaerochaetaceae bacterium]MDY0371976.1 sugar ABC transporter ATP-binding protein [Sphaerochaetaceae bacterium]